VFRGVRELDFWCVAKNTPEKFATSFFFFKSTSCSGTESCLSQDAYLFLQRSSRVPTIRTNSMHYLLSIYFKKLTSTCFEQAYCSSSGGTILYIQQFVYVMRLCWPAVPSRSCQQPFNINAWHTQFAVCTKVLDLVWNVMAHAQIPDFVFQRNGRVHLKREGVPVQSTAGSRGVRISGQWLCCL
jgi:hypothetical protein